MTSWQSNAPQHSLDSAHIAPRAVHSAGPGRHMPIVQTPSSQHSESSTQVPPIGRHVHVPLSHSIHPQQSNELTQSSSWPVQHVGSAGEGMHDFESQQSSSTGLHVSPSAVHSPEQKSRSQCRPPAHVKDGRQQICPSSPQPSVSVIVMRPTHMFVRNGSQIEPSPHSLPAQQGWPSPPHSEPSVPGVGLIMHIPLMHVELRTHAMSGAQQGIPGVPQPIGVWHMPLKHNSAELDPQPPPAPSQQGSPIRPHVVQLVPPMHARPDRHTLPVQHMPPITPQPSVGIVHVSSMHARSVPHSLDPIQSEPTGALHSPV